MKITIENAAADYSRSVNGIPPIDTQRAVTSVLVPRRRDDGHRRHLRQPRNRPTRAGRRCCTRFRCSGWLFKRDITAEENRELLIFITPRIIKL